MPEDDFLFDDEAVFSAPEETGSAAAEETPKSAKRPRKRKPKQEPELSFEEALERLEKVVAEMESGELSLEACLQRFEEGSKLAGYCSRSLAAIEQKVEVLLEKDDGTIETRELQQAGGE